MKRQVFDRLQNLTTESLNPRTRDLDTMSVGEILKAMSHEDAEVAPAVAKVLPQVEQAVALVEMSFRNGGRLFYVGAGTSGRLGVLDAAECPPTFGTEPEIVQGIIAGGYGALLKSAEGAEDDDKAGADELKKRRLSPKDTVVGIAASTRTPYVMGALQYARTTGCKTVLVTCNDVPGKEVPADVVIAPVVGPELVAGSTRLKAGTATKMILNMITTASMVRLGKTWGNLMVDLKAWSEKLQARSCRILTLATGCTFEEAVEWLQKADGELKTAIVMALGKVDAAEARKRLQENDGRVRGALDRIGPDNHKK
jgi:N-acetylmuramic acid 6-phosphate etherase